MSERTEKTEAARVDVLSDEATRGEVSDPMTVSAGDGDAAGKSAAAKSAAGDIAADETETSKSAAAKNRATAMLKKPLLKQNPQPLVQRRIRMHRNMLILPQSLKTIQKDRRNVSYCCCCLTYLHCGVHSYGARFFCRGSA